MHSPQSRLMRGIRPSSQRVNMDWACASRARTITAAVNPLNSGYSRALDMVSDRFTPRRVAKDNVAIRDVMTAKRTAALYEDFRKCQARWRCPLRSYALSPSFVPLSFQLTPYSCCLSLNLVFASTVSAITSASYPRVLLQQPPSKQLVNWLNRSPLRLWRSERFATAFFDNSLSPPSLSYCLSVSSLACTEGLIGYTVLETTRAFTSSDGPSWPRCGVDLRSAACTEYRTASTRATSTFDFA